MNTIYRWSLRATALGLAAALSGLLACSSGTSSGCGPSSDTSSNSSNAPVVVCGPGTVQQGNQCVATSPVH